MNRVRYYGPSLVLLVVACTKPPSGDVSTPAPAGDVKPAPVDAEMQIPRVTADKTTLLFSWLDERGRVRANE